MSGQTAVAGNQGQPKKHPLADKYAKEAMKEQEDRRKYEAGGAEGRVTPAFVLGAQRYPRFSWMRSKRQDRMSADYRKAAELVEELDRRSGLDQR